MSNVGSLNQQSSPAVRLMLVEDDPIFRVELVGCLRAIPSLQVILEADSVPAALQQVLLLVEQADDRHPAVVLLSLDLGRSQGYRTQGLALCRRLKARYPTLPLLVLSADPDPKLLAKAMKVGAEGFWLKGSQPAELVAAIRQVATGQTHWQQGMQIVAQSSRPQPVPVAPAPVSPRPFLRLRRNIRKAGLHQIEAAIVQINAQLQYPALSPLNELLLTGRRRELRAAHWLVNQLAPRLPEPPNPEPSNPESLNPELPHPASRLQPPPPATAPPDPSAIQPAASANLRSLRAALFDSISVKLQSSLRNLTTTPLEIDILNEGKKRELLYILLKKLETTLDELRFSQVTAAQIAEKRSMILVDIWQATIAEFFGKYYTLLIDDRAIEMVSVILQDQAIIQVEILDKIPLIPELLTHLLFQTPLQIDDSSYAAGTVEAMVRLEMILQNWLVQTANAVMQPLLNRFGDIPLIKQTFYDTRLLSSREIERFRNNLSWKYRVEKLVGEPTAIFESRLPLWVLNEVGISRTSIYAARNAELAQLSGIQFAVTLALEARDAIAPRLRSTVALIGSGVVYVLTEVIGRGIGLVGRGIIKGIGNALQDPKHRRGGEQERS